MSHESVKHELLKLMAEHLAEISYEKITEDALSRFDLSWGNSFGERFCEHVAKLLAERYAKEHYEEIADKIDIGRLVKMVQMKAVGKTLE